MKVVVTLNSYVILQAECSRIDQEGGCLALFDENDVLTHCFAANEWMYVFPAGTVLQPAEPTQG